MNSLFSESYVLKCVFQPLLNMNGGSEEHLIRFLDHNPFSSKL